MPRLAHTSSANHPAAKYATIFSHALEARIASVRLAERLPGIRLAEGEPEWHDSLILRGVKSLPVTL